MESNKVFKAGAKTFHELFIGEGGVAGFRVPIYQRKYDWDEENIQRLFEDISSGLFWRAEDQNSLSFLGTIIVVNEDTNEKFFDGYSLSVIDGQQRLTTISLLATILYEKIRSAVESCPETTEIVDEWINEEARFCQNQLLDFIYGEVKVGGGERFPFPRIVREYDDSRAKDEKYSEYRSAIADYLSSFSKYITNKTPPPFDYTFKPGLEDHKALERNLNVIISYLDEISGESSETTLTLPERKHFEKAGYRQLFKKLPEDESSKNKLLSYCKNSNEQVFGIYKLLAFANFLMSSVIITVVKTEDEKYAFDIFDSLNTTGEPLTAIQTFKPQIIRFENDLGGNGYLGSKSEEWFKKIELFLEQFKSSDKRQKEAKDLIVPFALYMTGEKLARSLDEQRRYLRSKFNSIKGDNKKEKKCKFVQRLAEVSDFKYRFWTEKRLVTQLPNYPEREILLLCLKFLYDLKKTLTIPILCRYYTVTLERDDKKIFTEAIKALTAFVALRRGATGGTQGIDSDFRSLMSFGRKSKPATPLCIGIKDESKVVEISEFKDYLKDWLRKKRIEIKDKESWVAKVSNQSLASSSSPLCRFLILAAYHNTRVDTEKSWKLTKARKGRDNDYLNFNTWKADEMATVEHIAPESPNSAWDDLIYKQPFLKQTLGNLTLLPQAENSAAANRSWKHKRLLYQAFSAETESDIHHIIEHAKKEGFNFSEKNKDLIFSGTHMPWAKSISSANTWDGKMIKKRSINLAELAWDEISPWLYE